MPKASSSTKSAKDSSAQSEKPAIGHGGGVLNRLPSSLIADAMRGNARAVQIVARKGKDDKKDWTMMSEAEKDELSNSVANLDRY